ncbi:multidrug transporter [Mycobacterium gordonae]|nr:multidrug transporter [Mycobacterium gordonae]OBK58951.1 multidrug transporter [Mycobacterium gordonae]
MYICAQGRVVVAYAFLLVAIFAEVAATSLLKSTEGFTRPWPTVICLLGYAVSFALLALSISRGMQTDVAYALWSAIGTAVIVFIAVVFLGSPLSAAKLIGVGLIIGGVVTLNLGGAH